MRPEQLNQLASSHNGLVSKMQQLVTRRKELAQLVRTGGQESAKDQQPLLSNMAQVPSNVFPGLPSVKNKRKE